MIFFLGGGGGGSNEVKQKQAVPAIFHTDMLNVSNKDRITI